MLRSDYWSNAEIAFLKIMYPTSGRQLIADALGRTPRAVMNQVVRLRNAGVAINKAAAFHQKKKWTVAEEKLLVALYPESGLNALAVLFGASANAVKSRACLLGVTRSDNYNAWISIKKQGNLVGDAALAKRFFGAETEADVQYLVQNMPAVLELKRTQMKLNGKRNRIAGAAGSATGQNL